MKQSEFKKDTRYVYAVEYDDKSTKQTQEVIKKVKYYRWDNQENKLVKKNWERENFAKALEAKEFKAIAGNDCGDTFTNAVEIVAYKQDGNTWIKTSPDDKKYNNLEFLELAKKLWCKR